MITTTPIPQTAAHRHASKASTSQLPSRPTTPLRPASRTSLRAQTTPDITTAANAEIDFPLSRLEPAFAELSDSMADLEANFMHLQLLNESIARFNENFASFLYGLNMTAFCVDFPEAPIPQSFSRHVSDTCQLGASPFRDMRTRPAEEALSRDNHDAATDATFMTGDTSFVENPPMSTKPPSKYPTAASKRGTARAGGFQRGTAASRGRVPVAGVDENGRRTTRLPSGASRGRGSTTTRGRGRQ